MKVEDSMQKSLLKEYHSLLINIPTVAHSLLDKEVEVKKM